MRIILLALMTLFTTIIHTQTVADFENFNLGANMSDKDGDNDNGYTSGDIFFPNTYNADFDSWTDWAISTLKDTITEGFLNSLSSFAGGGKESLTYAVAAAYEPVMFKMQDASLGKTINGLYISNNTYAALSMRNGDSFAKKFGGESGNDKDYFKVTIRKWLNGEQSNDSIDFYLADYRFDDNSSDYIVKDWTYIDLESLGAIDSLEFTLSSSDVGVFGMNTPALFCIDNVLVEIESSTTEARMSTNFVVYPNPTRDVIIFNGHNNKEDKAIIYDVLGRMVKKQILSNNRIDVQNLSSGTYFVKIEGYNVQRFVKE